MSGVHAWREEEGEEKHPPVGKDINRPKFPNNTPPCRYDDARVTRHSRVELYTHFHAFRVGSTTRGLHVILAWNYRHISTRFAWDPRKLGLHAWMVQRGLHVILAWNYRHISTRFAWGPRKLGLHAWMVQGSAAHRLLVSVLRHSGFLSLPFCIV